MWLNSIYIKFPFYNGGWYKIAHCDRRICVLVLSHTDIYLTVYRIELQEISYDGWNNIWIAWMFLRRLSFCITEGFLGALFLSKLLGSL